MQLQIFPISKLLQVDINYDWAIHLLSHRLVLWNRLFTEINGFLGLYTYFHACKLTCHFFEAFKFVKLTIVVSFEHLSHGNASTHFKYSFELCMIKVKEEYENKNSKSFVFTTAGWKVQYKKKVIKTVSNRLTPHCTFLFIFCASAW